MTRFGRIVIPLVAVLTAVGVIALARRPVRVTFASPRQAVEQLVSALRANNLDAAELILGRGSEDLIRSGDKATDRELRRRFVAAYDRHMAFVGKTPSRLTLLVGTDNWPFPIPLVKEKRGWQFNSGPGLHELLARRIAGNEMNAINECKTFVDAEREYKRRDHGDGYLEYARRLNSTGKKHDGLYWPAVTGSQAGPSGQSSPLGAAFAHAELGPGNDHAVPYNGYYFRVLAAQGPAAKGGAYSYIADGRMIGGFAIIAFPVKYGSTGVRSFIVNDDDVVFKKDLGARTRKIAERILKFNPGPGWSRANS